MEGIPKWAGTNILAMPTASRYSRYRGQNGDQKYLNNN